MLMISWSKKARKYSSSFDFSVGRKSAVKPAATTSKFGVRASNESSAVSQTKSVSEKSETSISSSLSIYISLELDKLSISISLKISKALDHVRLQPLLVLGISGSII